MAKRYITDVIVKWIYPPNYPWRGDALGKYLETDARPEYRLAAVTEFTDSAAIEYYRLVWEMK